MGSEMAPGETVKAGAKRKAESTVGEIIRADGGAEDEIGIASNETTKTHIPPVEDEDSEDDSDSGDEDDLEGQDDEEDSIEDHGEYGEDDDDDHDSKYDVEESQFIVNGPSPPRLLALKLCIEKECDSQQWMHTIHLSCKHNGKIVGEAHGQHINRDSIRADFFQFMDAPTQGMSELAFEIFDRYGCLKKELKDHPVRTGSGAWGSELDIGKVFFIEHIRVDSEWRRLGLATNMAKALIRKAESHDGGVSFSLTIPGWLNNDELDSEVRDKSRKESSAIHSRHLRAASVFWRSLGFRRIGASTCFCFASDTAHKAHRLASGNEYDPTQHEVDDESDDDDSDDGNPWTRTEKLKEKALKRMKKITLVHHAITTLPDAQCVDFFKACMTAKDVADPGWTKVDSAHNNVLHVAARLSKPQAVVWLMENLDKDNLRLARNLEGYTPLEALQAMLEASRISMGWGTGRICTSDIFRGYSRESISCMGSLEELSNISGIEAQRLKYGCTCGECLMGFLSPRMSLLLLDETEMIYDELSEGIKEDDWCDFNEHHMDYVAPDLKENFRTNRSLRQGFGGMFDLIASCLHQNICPTEANVLQEWSISHESPVTLNFFAEGGDVEMALRNVFDSARDHDDKAGDGYIMEMLEDDIFALPECRNDREFGFVALACGLEDKHPLA